jgi:Protein of unknown function (DUF3237)
MDLHRRDLLKLLAASAAVGSADSLLRFTRARAASPQSSPLAERASMTSRHLLTVKLATSPVQVIGPVPLGSRSVFPIVGGQFEGPRVRGKVLPGGGDWALLRSDGVLELDLRITLQTDDGALIYMTFTGLRHGPADVIAGLGRGEVVDPARYYFRTAPRFETASEKYSFLNRLLAIGSGENQPTGAVHVIDEIL